MNLYIIVFTCDPGARPIAFLLNCTMKLCSAPPDPLCAVSCNAGLPLAPRTQDPPSDRPFAPSAGQNARF